MKIGILLTGHAPDETIAVHGEYDVMFRRLLGEESFTYQSFAVVDGEFPDDPHQCDGWLITGSRHAVYEEHDWLAPLEAFVREVYDRRIPMVGICFGHQLIAKAFGGQVEKFDGGWSVGREIYEIEDADGQNRKAAIVAFHQDQVLEPPPCARVIGSSDFCRYAALAYRDAAITYQPHPEFGPEFVIDLIEARREVVLPHAVAENALATVTGPLDSPSIGEDIRRFFLRTASS